MLFGNRNALGIEIRPLSPSWERYYPPEKTAWGALSVWVGGANVCAHLDLGSERIADALNVPLAPLADWLVRAWAYVTLEERATVYPIAGESLHVDLERWGESWPQHGLSWDEWVDTRYDWWQHHFLLSGADGAVLPSLALHREDEKLLLDWAPPRLPGAAVRFVEREGSAEVPWFDGEAAVAPFVAYIAEWLRNEGLADLYTWVPHTDPLANSLRSFAAKLELYTGRSEQELRDLTGAPDVARAAERLGLDPDSEDPAASPATQALRDLPPALSSPAGSLLSELDQATRNSQAIGLRRQRAIALDAGRDATTPEKAGYLAAEAVRKDLGLDGAPLDDVPTLLRLLDVSSDVSAAELKRARMITGLRAAGGAKTIILRSERTDTTWGCRFEQARALGYLLLDPMRSGSIGAASSSFSSPLRRRRSGAFAAEFLLPRKALLDFTGGQVDAAAADWAFPALMKKFGVGARTAAQHLWNVRLLSSTDVRDDLIDRHAAGY